MLLPGGGHVPSAYTSRRPVPRVRQGWQPQSSAQNGAPRPQVEAGREGAPSCCPDTALEAPTPWALVCQGENPTRLHPAFIQGAFTSTFLPPFTIFTHLEGLVLISVISLLQHSLIKTSAKIHDAHLISRLCCNVYTF